jgi:hypothetical protein
MEELKQIARESVEDLKERIQPVIEPALQSAGAGSM